MSSDAPPDAVPYTRDQRIEQLAGFVQLCRHIAGSLREHGEPSAADAFDDRADCADALLKHGWTRRDLNDVGAQFPNGVEWLNPKAVDFHGPREPWQQDIAVLHQRAGALALEIRATASLP